ncbi:MAG: twin-arginine translocation signal domain-containing protein, partial [Verrucomicrobia bacterium]|nr:twin-arginine translocation signal domain-containing protein [Verrucomicrobiota bacterium]
MGRLDDQRRRESEVTMNEPIIDITRRGFLGTVGSAAAGAGMVGA